ncbi:sialidase family protein [Flavilitoribacter nigricans]|nr:sialidase family protein [Flavilitoribacter nigricans]
MKPTHKTPFQSGANWPLLLFCMIGLSQLYNCATPAETSRNPLPDFRTGIVQEAFVYEQAPYPSCHAATIAETPDGLVGAWFGGTHERHPDVGIWVAHYRNGKWTESTEVANGVQSDTLRYPTWNPVLFQIPDGDLLLFYKVGPSPSTWWGMLKRSTDGGMTWSEADKLPDGFIGPVKNKPVLLPNGNLIAASSTEGDGWRVHFEISSDQGKSWRKVGPINNTSVYNIIQPSVLQHEDGRLQILCRSRNSVLATAWSDDQGESWSLVRESGLPNNNSGTDAVTLADGRQLVAYNHVKTPIGAKKGHRTPLNIAVSRDGKHWEAALVIEDSDISQYSYPAVIQTADGMVHLMYTWRRERIKHVVIDPDKLLTAPIVNERWPE